MTNSPTETNELRDVMANCFKLENPKSFFLFAGAGSGKTRALVEAMEMFRDKYGQEFRLSGRKVAVVTYTNAACYEIKHRIDYDSMFAVSTIHSFAWDLIRSHHNDIREWLRHKLPIDIGELEEKQKRGRAGTKAAADRAVQIKSKQERLERLDTIKYFTYNPNGENIGRHSLNHTEVICITADFLKNKSLMQKILIRKYPMCLIDESQDTQKDLLDAFFGVQCSHSGEFCLALFGDTMQRIYSDGKTDLEKHIPPDWAKPAITINHRCPKRIVKLINTVRSDADDHIQEPREDAPDGFIRLFLVQNEGVNRNTVEAEITKRMAEITSDAQWSGDNQEIKTLTLEHHMAARRGGFHEFFGPLYRIPEFKTGVLDGKLSGIPFFAQQMLPLVRSLQAENRFAVAQIVKKYSPLVSADSLKASKSALDEIRKADAAVQSLFSLWDGGSDPLLIDSLKAVADSGLFAIPDMFAPIVSRQDSTEEVSEPDDSGEITDSNPSIDAWDEALSAPFSQMASYVEYISDRSPFGTHQGIKGLQFPRVMVVLDDNEARGFMFSYEKLLGAKDRTSTDIKNEEEGKDTAIARTRRLFYVTCSRAQSSLAVVVYTGEKDKIIRQMRDIEWFDDGEVICI